MDRPPPVEYALTEDGVHIAYQVVGDRTADWQRDILFVGSWFGHVDGRWDTPGYAHLLRRLASFSRLIVFDKRGVGASDPAPPGSLTLEAWLEDARAVMDAAGSARAAVVVATDAAPMGAMFAATHPERVSSLVILNTLGRPEEYRERMEGIGRVWGTEASLDTIDVLAPSHADDPAYRESFLRAQRASAGPGAAAAMYAMLEAVDTRAALAAVHAPTLFVVRDGMAPRTVPDPLNEQIEGARVVWVPGEDVHIWAGDVEPFITEIQEFVTGTRPAVEPDRALLTVLFTDVVGSTERAAELGDRAWSELLGRHETAARRCIAEHRGHEIFTKGDEFLVTFDGPARAVRCGQAMVRAAATMGLQIRAGLHTGEVELRGDDIGGIAVHIGARVVATAAPGEVLVSRTVRDLVAGSGLAFEDAGSHVLKGVPDEWQLYRVGE